MHGGRIYHFPVGNTENKNMVENLEFDAKFRVRLPSALAARIKLWNIS
jgi:hypothetical protein